MFQDICDLMEDRSNRRASPALDQISLIRQLEDERDAAKIDAGSLRFQVDHLRSLLKAEALPDFDPERYLPLHPDLVAANADGREQWLLLIRQLEDERDAAKIDAGSLRIQVNHLRSLLKAEMPPDFDPERYVSLNPDLAAANADGREHWLLHGFFEGRNYR